MRLSRTSGGLLAVAAVVLTALTTLGAAPAQATHPCGMNPDGTTFDPSPTSDHAACSGPRPAPRPGDVQLGDADSGQTVTVATGARVYVDLHPTSGQIWAELDAGQALHRRYLDVQSGITSGVFTAMAATSGQQITAQTGMACEHSEPACRPPVQLWSVTVVVQGASSASSSDTCSPRPTPATGEGVTVLTESSNGSTVRVPRGNAILVSFVGCQGLDLRPPVGGDALYRYRVNASNPGGATTVFRASRLGSASLTSSSDVPCSHEAAPCPTAFRNWSVTVEVVEAVEPCVLSGPVGAPAGTAVQLSGRFAANAAVEVWLRQRGAATFVVRRQLTADAAGFVATSYVARDDYRWYATTSSCTTTAGLTTVAPLVSGPAAVARGTSVPVSVRGPAGTAVSLVMRAPGGVFEVRRTGRLDASGIYRTAYVAITDERYYAVTGPDRRVSAAALTQVR